MSFLTLFSSVFNRGQAQQPQAFRPPPVSSVSTPVIIGVFACVAVVAYLAVR